RVGGLPGPVRQDEGAHTLVGEDLQQHGVRLTAVDDVGLRDAAAHGAQARLHLGDHPGLEVGEHEAELGGVDAPDDRGAVRPRAVQAIDVGEDDELAGPEGDREGRGRRVGVDVEHLAAVGDVGVDGRDHRYRPGGEEVLDGRGVDLDDVADEADVHRLAVDDGGAPLGAQQAAVLAGDPDGVRSALVEEGDEVALDLPGEHHPYDGHGLGGGDPQAAAELRGDVEAVEHRGDLRATAVDDDRLHADLVEEEDVGREGALEPLVDHGVAAVLDDDAGAGEALEPRQGLDEHLGLLVGPQARGEVGHVEYALFSWT